MNIKSLLMTKAPYGSTSEFYIERYIKFINSRTTSKGENHHILPKGSRYWPEYKSFKDHPWNKAILTPREHFIAHWMLAKAFGGGMSIALSMMMNAENQSQTRYTTNSKNYERLRQLYFSNKMDDETRRKMSQSHKGKAKTEEHKANISKALKGKPKSEKEKERLSILHKGKTISESQKEAIRNAAKGRIKSEEELEKLRIAHKGKPKSLCDKPCLYCGKITTHSNMVRWHNDNCKFRPLFP